MTPQKDGDEFPFGAPEPVASAPTALAAGSTALEYALWANPDEDWDVCCMCGCAGDCATYDFLARALVLLADGSLARSAWCFKMACADERYASTRITWSAE